MTFPEALTVIFFAFANVVGLVHSTWGQAQCKPHDQRCDRLRWGSEYKCRCSIYQRIKDAPREFCTRGDLIARNLPLSLLGRWLSEKPYAIPDPPPAPSIQPLSAVRGQSALTNTEYAYGDSLGR